MLEQLAQNALKQVMTNQWVMAVLLAVACVILIKIGIKILHIIAIILLIAIAWYSLGGIIY